jgi:hypothetical protein
VGLFEGPQKILARSDYYFAASFGGIDYFYGVFCPGALHLHAVLKK